MTTINQAQLDNILKLVAGMFDAAPGKDYLNEITQAFIANGGNYAALADSLGQTTPFQDVYPSFLTAEAFATKFLTSLGLEDNEEAQAFVAARLEAGDSFSTVIYASLEALVNSTSDEFADARAQLENKAEVAEYYSVTLGKSSDDMATLQSVVAGVTEDPATVEAGKEAADDSGNAGETFTLTASGNAQTAGVDDITGTSGDDIFRAVPGSNAAGVAEGTLSTVDILDGAEGYDVLNISLLGINATAGLNAPTIRNVERINNAEQTTGLNLANVTGVEQIWSTGANTGHTYTNANLGIVFGASTSAAVAKTVNIDLAASVVLTGDNDTVQFAMSNNGTTAAPTAITFDVDDSTGAAVEAAIENVAITTVAGGQTAGDAQLATFVSMEKLTVAGDGNVTLTLGAGPGNLKTLDASGNTGNVTTILDNLRLLEPTVSATFGDGNDVLTIDVQQSVAATATSITGGAGNDQFTFRDTAGTGNLVAAGNSSDLAASLITITDFGNGADTLNISALTGATIAHNVVQTAVDAVVVKNLFSVTQAAMATGAAAANNTYIFEWESDLYIAVDVDGNRLDSGDTLIKLAGVEFTDLTTANFVG